MKKHIIIAIALFCTATQTWALSNSSATTDGKTEEVQVSPVLSGNKLIVKTGTINKARINVISVSGKAVAQLDTQSNETTLNVSRFPSGNYLLEIWTQDGNMVSKSFTIAR